MFRLLKGLGRADSLAFPLPVSRAGSSTQLGPVSLVSRPMFRKRDWGAAGGCGQAGLGAGALAMCSYLGTEMEERVHLCPGRATAVWEPLPRARGLE